MRVPTPRKMALRQRIAAATGLVAKSSRGQFGVARSLLCSPPFFKPYNGFFLVWRFCHRPYRGSSPLQLQLQYLRTLRIFHFVQTSRLRSPFPNCQDGAKNAGKRSDRQADRRSGPGKSESSSWPGLGQQRSQEHGLLQGTYILHQKCSRPVIDHDLQEFNARTAHITPGVPVPARVTVRPDRSFSFEIRTPTTSWLLLQAAGVKEIKNRIRGAQKPGTESVGTVTLKHVYEIARIKQTETRLSGLSLEGLCKSVISQAKSIGVAVVP